MVDINTATSVFLWLIFACFSLSTLFVLTYVFMFKAHLLQITYSWVLWFLIEESYHLCHLISMCNPFIFNIMIEWLGSSLPSCYLFSFVPEVHCSFSSFFHTLLWILIFHLIISTGFLEHILIFFSSYSRGYYIYP